MWRLSCLHISGSLVADIGNDTGTQATLIYIRIPTISSKKLIFSKIAAATCLWSEAGNSVQIQRAALEAWWVKGGENDRARRGFRGGVS